MSLHLPAQLPAQLSAEPAVKAAEANIAELEKVRFLDALTILRI
jgi:hypothetical protein